MKKVNEEIIPRGNMENDSPASKGFDIRVKIVFMAVVMVAAVLLKPLFDSLLKDMTLSSLRLDSEDKVVSAVYRFELECGLFASENDCLESVVYKIGISNEIEMSEKERAIEIANKIVYMMN